VTPRSIKTVAKPKPSKKKPSSKKQSAADVNDPLKGWIAITRYLGIRVATAHRWASATQQTFLGIFISPSHPAKPLA
jgi:hypothetical protein